MPKKRAFSTPRATRWIAITGPAALAVLVVKPAATPVPTAAVVEDATREVSGALQTRIRSEVSVRVTAAAAAQPPGGGIHQLDLGRGVGDVVGQRGSSMDRGCQRLQLVGVARVGPQVLDLLGSVGQGHRE